MSQKFVHINGLDLMQRGQKLFLKGVSLGNWLILEDHMSGIPYVEHKARERFQAVLGETTGKAFFDIYQETYMTERDIDYLASLGINLLRIPFNYRLLEDGMNPGCYLDDNFKYIDRIIAWAKKRGMLVLLDLHAAPGCQAVDWNVDCAGPDALFWKEKDYQTRTIKLWRHIAARYRDEETVMGYELLGEPVASAPMVFNHAMVQDFYRAIIPAVREEDPNHILILVANCWGKASESLSNDLFDDPQVMPAPHFYPYEVFPYSQIDRYPNQVVDRKKLMAVIENRSDQERFQRPILYGEFGINYKESPEPIYQLTEDEVSIFAEKGYHWCIWAYKDIGPFGFVNPSPDGLWKQFLSRPDIQKEKAALDQLCSVNFDAGTPAQSVFFDSVRALFPHLDFEYTQHRVREARRNLELLLLDSFLLKLREHSDDEILAMARSFSFDQCVPHPRGEALIRKLCSMTSPQAGRSFSR